jgi:hypothetical protein
MIEFTLRLNYEKIYINKDKIMWIKPHAEGCWVYVEGIESFNVVEPIADVLKKFKSKS